jgi:hypothetical protein
MKKMAWLLCALALVVLGSPSSGSSVGRLVPRPTSTSVQCPILPPGCCVAFNGVCRYCKGFGCEYP